MANLFRFTDDVVFDITCADIAIFLDRLGQKGVSVHDTKIIGELTVRMRCKKSDLKVIKNYACSSGAELNVRKLCGFTALTQRFTKRLILLSAALLFLLLIFVLPSRVLFVRVEGNNVISTNRILDAAERSGIYFGASRRQIRNESVKNALVSSIPELQWVGINTSGCVATIQVREKSITQDAHSVAAPGRVVAAIDGIIHSSTVINGTPLCRAGEAVTAGQTLISGYVDCGIALKSVRAQGEVIAQTRREITAITPDCCSKRQAMQQSKTTYALLIGKKLINFDKGSGISDSSCVKMYSQDYLALPGGFQLPIALVTQQTLYYSTIPQDTADAEQLLADYGRDYILDLMQAGQILEDNIRFFQSEGVFGLRGEYICLEMIGQFVNEEIISNDGQTD